MRCLGMGVVVLGVLAAVGGANRAEAKISKELIAYSLGRNLGLAAVGHAQGAPEGAVTNIFKKAEILAKALGTSVPPLPPKTGVRAKDSAAVLRYLLKQAGAPIHGHLKAAHGAKAAALFELANKANLLAMIYVPGDSLGVSASKGIANAATKAGVPAALWTSLVVKVQTKAPYPQVKDAVFALHKAVEAHLR
ncbi:MAG: hypothetical protein IT371_08575 [Deltaproteobacteria bacterium]|nr:hypothetical protein [Deltaproteobacteria bacterium]